MNARGAAAGLPAAFALWVAPLCGSASAATLPPETLIIDASAGPAARFDRDVALGAAIDGMERGGVAALFTRHNLERMEAAGLGPLTYRLRTELAIEAWHWGGEGAWSDPARREGYWTSSDHPRLPILTSWGYRLPRRGDTFDEAANHGYSRLDDGDPNTFWKTNPYLDAAYTGHAPRPQWAVVAFPAEVGVDAARIRWAIPFARRFEVQYWVGVDEYDDEGRWVTFPGGDISDGQGGDALLRLADTPIRARFFRLRLEESSRTAPPGAVDPRDAMGFAVAELGLGALDGKGRFVDAIRHGTSSRTQTPIYVSSTDPWHRAVDRDANLEQPGFDRVFQSGLTRGLPMMVPVGALYDTPANAAAEVRFLKARGYPVRQVELGEEPDGQNVDGEDFADLFIQFAAAVHGVDPTLVTGGPSLQQAAADTWLDPSPDHSWTHHLLRALAARGRMDDLGFFSFERYPVEDLCGPQDEKLRDESVNLPLDLARLRQDEVPPATPLIITEYGYSAYGAQAEVGMTAALLNADIAAHFLRAGGQGAYLFGYPPSRPYASGHACAGQGNMMLFESDRRGQARAPMPTFFGARMLTQDWAGPGTVTIYPLSGQDSRRPWVSAYAALRADRRWSVLLINRDPHSARPIRLALRESADLAPRDLNGPAEAVDYGADQYEWPSPDETGGPLKDRPPRRTRLGPGPLTLTAAAILHDGGHRRRAGLRYGKVARITNDWLDRAQVSAALGPRSALRFAGHADRLQGPVAANPARGRRGRPSHAAIAIGRRPA